MKKLKKLVIFALCLMLLQVPVTHITQPVTVQAAVKSGLKKERGKYYYYSNGRKIRNQWKTIKVKIKGKTYPYRYYFGKDGAAYKGTKRYGVEVPAVKKINGKYYGFSSKSRMVKGTYVINGKFYIFNKKTGVYEAAGSKKVRSAAKYQKDSAALRKYLRKPKKTFNADSCYGDGKDVICYYDHFMVCYFKDYKGKEIVLDFAAI